MANKITVQQYVAMEALRGLYNDSVLIGNCDRQYTAMFAKEGAKTGRKITLKKPARFLATTGKNYQPQDISEDTLEVVLGDVTGVHFELDLLEATLDIDSKDAAYSKRVIMPAGHALGAKVEANGFAAAAKNANSALVLTGAPTLKDFNKARGILQKNLAPSSDRITVAGSDTEVELTDSVKGFFNTTAMVESAIKKGEMTDIYGSRWMRSEMGYVHTNGGGTGKTITVTLPGTGTETLTVTLGGADVASAKAGDTLSLGVKLVNPETKQVTSQTAQRTIVSIDGSNVATLSEKIVWSGVTQNVAAKPTTVTFLGVAGQSYLVDLVYHKSAIALVNPDLYLPRNLELAFRTDGEFDPNLSILYTRDYDSGDMGLQNRLDGLFTWAFPRPEWIVKVMTPIS